MEKAKMLAELLKEYSLTEVTYSDSNESLTLKKETVRETLKGAGINDLSAERTEAFPGETVESPRDEEKVYFFSPLAGIFYSRPDPDSKPFVKAGDKVKKGDVLFIVETMKIMNEVRSDRDFKINSILKDDGSIVEFQERVFEVEDEQGRA